MCPEKVLTHQYVILSDEANWLKTGGFNPMMENKTVYIHRNYVGVFFEMVFI